MATSRLFSSCGAQASRVGGFSCCGAWALEHRLSSCGVWAWLLCGIWDPPGPGIEPMWTGRPGVLRFMGLQRVGCD